MWLAIQAHYTKFHSFSLKEKSQNKNIIQTNTKNTERRKKRRDQGRSNYLI